MKKFILRDEYEAISRDELKAFADEINRKDENKRLNEVRELASWMWLNMLLLESKAMKFKRIIKK